METYFILSGLYKEVLLYNTYYFDVFLLLIVFVLFYSVHLLYQSFHLTILFVCFEFFFKLVLYLNFFTQFNLVRTSINCFAFGSLLVFKFLYADFVFCFCFFYPHPFLPCQPNHLATKPLPDLPTPCYPSAVWR